MGGIYILLMTVVALLSVVLFHRFRIYQAWRGNSLHKEVANISLSWVTALLVATAFVYINKVGVQYSRGWMGTWALLGWVNLVFAHISLRIVLMALRRRGYNSKLVVIVGRPQLTSEIATRVMGQPWMGFKIAGVFLADAAELSADMGDIPILGGISEVAHYAQNRKIDQIWLAMSLRDELEMKYLLYGLRHSTADIRLFPDIFTFQLLNHSISEVAGFPVIDLSVTPMVGMNQLAKTLLDMTLTPILLIFVAPLMLLIACGVKLSSQGPVLFRQNRLGMDGKEFAVFKFRTMVLHKEMPGVVVQATKNDVRVTPFGLFLRRSSLDELPQLFNVLRGEMSLVGPRPHAIEHNELYKNAVQGYMLRHKVKPGMTGWAQVNGWRGESDTLEKMQKRVECDLYYIENWSIFFDLWIMVLTALKGLRHSNAY
jgi:putative colanic acid biosynthesis UDP-glucose lipid carrier transferase